jgi:hypothetical protein
MMVIQTVGTRVALPPSPQSLKIYIHGAVSSRRYFGGWGRTLLSIYQLMVTKLTSETFRNDVSGGFEGNVRAICFVGILTESASNAPNCTEVGGDLQGCCF